MATMLQRYPSRVGLLTILLCTTLFFPHALLSGCSRETPWKPGAPLPKEKIVIGVIHVNDAKTGYSYAHDQGIRIMQERLGLKDSQIIRKLNVNDADTNMVEHMMRQCIEEGANIILATSWGHAAICEKLAAAYPSVIFANASGAKHNGTNLTNYFGRMYQARYCSGIAAGMKTQTGKIGFVAAMGKANSEVTSGIDAFALGVESVNPAARVYVRVTNSWFDPSGERRATQRLLEAGCDVIAQHCNNPDPQIQAEKAGAWGIGFNSDMEKDAPNAVLTSVIWKWDAYYISLVRSVIDGSFTTAPYLKGIKEGMVDIAPLNKALTTPGMEDAVNAARSRIISGGCNVFDGLMRTDDGKTVGVAGGTLSDDTIRHNINWYYHTVIEL